MSTLRIFFANLSFLFAKNAIVSIKKSEIAIYFESKILLSC